MLRPSSLRGVSRDSGGGHLVLLGVQLGLDAGGRCEARRQAHLEGELRRGAVGVEHGARFVEQPQAGGGNRDDRRDDDGQAPGDGAEREAAALAQHEHDAGDQADEPADGADAPDRQHAAAAFEVGDAEKCRRGRW